MLVLGKLCFPGDNIVLTGTLSADTPDPDPDYDVDQLKNTDPAWVLKSTTNTLAVTVNAGLDVTPVAVSVHTTNATVASITNGAGLNKAILIPAVDLGGQRHGGWADLTEELNAEDNEFVVNLSAPSGIVWVGNICIWLAARDVNWESGRDEGIDWPGHETIRTRLGSLVHDPQAIAIHQWAMTFTLLEDRATYRALALNTQGPLYGFALIPDVLENDAAWVHNPDAYTEQRLDPMVRIPRRFVELSQGPPNG